MVWPIPFPIRNRRSSPLHTSAYPCMSDLPFALTTSGQREHSKKRDATRFIPTVIAQTPRPCQKQDEQIVPLYPESFVPSSGARQIKLLVQVTRLHLCCIFYVGQAFSLTISRPNREGGENESLPDLLLLFPQLSTLLTDFTPAKPRRYREVTAVCFMITLFYSASRAFSSAFTALIRAPCLDNRAIVSLSERGSGSVNPFPFSRFISPATHYCLY